MKPCINLFPSYYFCNEDEAVFFELSDHSNLSRVELKNDNDDTGKDTSSDGDINDDTIKVTNDSATENILKASSAITGSSHLVDLLVRAKNESNSYGRKVFEELRGKTNPYEGLSKGCFLNRSAMKLINLDYVFSLIEPSVISDSSDINSAFNTAADKYRIEANETYSTGDLIHQLLFLYS